MNESTRELFRTLTEFPAAPGFERELRAWVKNALSPYTEEFVQDRLGSLFAVLRGNDEGPRVMVAGHMDEVGFMVTGITEAGMVRFQPLGGWWSQAVLAQRLQIITDNGPIIGVVGSIPTHLLDEAQRSKPVDIKSMYIDIGADNKAEAESFGIRPGQQIVPICEFTPLANPKKIMAKAWDNRYGVGLAIELVQALHGEKLPNTVYAGATVQEELGLRGARTAANLIQPDIFFGLDASAANDMMGDKSQFGQLGQGALLRIFDPTMLTHRGMVEYVQDTAETNKIKYQYFVSPGGTDAGQVHLSGIGVPSTIIGICSRYIHTSSSIIHTDDYEAAKELLIKLVKGLDRTTLQTILDRA
ncbi:MULTISPECIES: M42 family metallopeptidase [Paenibacillus]|uniref:Aminopeptidase FrvX n=1 Tax=Paenibacillus lactis TaxID=228574 RepID=A0ABS4FFR5_9BACL|nr:MULTISPECIES: M42 family metallopeptidase [Paenibacillus]MBP1895089.1 putative aminopeptidase FrvX [Paenibacillus lactis]MCM3495673.1 M42 family metallopeptidase [Paenibacillus lactis]GIO90615.1 peptidase M28 [Paenibacillus lactis]HAF99783.1 M42 family peptidase [Paenibacillus lactis]